VFPHFLPDGRHFTYLAQGTPSKVYLASLDPTESRQTLATLRSEAYVDSGFMLTAADQTLRAQQLTSSGTRTTGELIPIALNVTDYRMAGHFAFASSAGVLAYVATVPRPFQFSLLDRGARTLAVIGSSILLDAQMLGGAPSWSLSPDGEKVAFAQQDAETHKGHIWLYDRVRDSATRFTSAPGSDSHPLWAPSGDRIVFLRMAEDESWALHVKHLGSDIEAQLGQSSAYLEAPYDWHPNGQMLLFGTPTDQYNLWLLRTNDGEQPKRWFTSPSRHVAGQFSPDGGQWVAYESNESGTDEIWVRRFPSADGKVQISTAGGRLPRWRRDGRALFYVQDEMLMEADLDIGATAKAGTPRPLFKLEESVGYAVLPDGKRFVLCRPIDALPPPTITVVQNWVAGLKAK
jgi:hypothetical protein